MFNGLKQQPLFSCWFPMSYWGRALCWGCFPAQGSCIFTHVLPVTISCPVKKMVWHGVCKCEVMHDIIITRTLLVCHKLLLPPLPSAPLPTVSAFHWRFHSYETNWVGSWRYLLKWVKSWAGYKRLTMHSDVLSYHEDKWATLKTDTGIVSLSPQHHCWKLGPEQALATVLSLRTRLQEGLTLWIVLELKYRGQSQLVLSSREQVERAAGSTPATWRESRACGEEPLLVLGASVR